MFKIIKYTRKRNETTSETESEQSLNYIYVTTRSPDTDVKIDFCDLRLVLFFICSRSFVPSVKLQIDPDVVEDQQQDLERKKLKVKEVHLTKLLSTKVSDRRLDWGK